MFNWIKALFAKPEPEIHYVISLADFAPKEKKPVAKRKPRPKVKKEPAYDPYWENIKAGQNAIEALKNKPRAPRRKKATVVTTGSLTKKPAAKKTTTKGKK
jgi:hypothetical protein